MRPSKVIIPLCHANFILLIYLYLATPAAGGGYGSSFLHTKLLDRARNEHSHHNPCQELVSYLSSPLELDIKDPVRWWGVSGL